MINKEIVINDELPLYEVQEVSLLDAMLLLKGYGESTRESSISRAAELLKQRSYARSDPVNWPMTGS
ncbi:MAG: hypothetical protein KME56_19350 [Candidatus Thiodiazotropha sp. (ex Ctena orbiculata)]|uniref:Uncharacterized protein n=1 Tax=Candidatus Thiodiazotropha taylori TaxID=2792791 RepID=A0A944MAG1_9GAMM|nr:hypothetical protein [Candidatus Thiodiazotropha taylori]PUB83414.1 MAG: hypothetical protein DBP00_16155 [gamma proteobacterium symbiont of Ctena orbiculata]MBT2988313.1 hypothetical protein [Candidatus Thiodiazotropha taylori]MBT2998770.1 hypothetical protein [Candidatus Thiodiazotropha taylori]MBT2999568.1 hypothetical protein [Candidatus Thiodiazotropha taylori]